ncbi:dienelactone hydrolase family protein [Rhizobium sp. 2YAF20]|uniref:dienelactone hydrolase family protein n=1 Tax=Rhizobium sp. 2YAF20 TaxID=3233027 RepID=UPI003F9B5FCF
MPIETTDVDIPIDGKTMGAYLARPTGTPKGSVVMIQEIFGVTSAMRAIADDFAASGFAILVPDIYWRLQPGLDLGNGEDPVQRDLAVDYSTRIDETRCALDLAASIEWLAKTVPTEKRPGVMGFCLGGRLAVRVGAASTPSCVISMYGVKVDLLEKEIKSSSCPLQFHYGDQDNHNPLEVIDTVHAWVNDRVRSDDEFYVYPGAEHAFFNRFRTDRFSPKAHELARERVLGFLSKYAAG